MQACQHAFVIGATSVPVPDFNCYALDNSSRLVDFSSWIGHPFEYDGKEFDLVVRFCKDVETRGQTGYVDMGRFDPLSYFVSSSGNFGFVQGFYHGELSNCEQSYDKLGRTLQVNIICGNCSDGRCKAAFASGGLGCICSVTQDSTCRVTDDLAIPCEKPGPLVFKGFKCSSRSDQQSSRWINHTSSCGGFERTHRDGAVTLGFGSFGYS
ncbi:hypothetical protein ISN44_As11g028040, partial [Arabidopsis suecica]